MYFRATPSDDAGGRAPTFLESIALVSRCGSKRFPTDLFWSCSSGRFLRPGYFRVISPDVGGGRPSAEYLRSASSDVAALGVWDLFTQL